MPTPQTAPTPPSAAPVAIIGATGRLGRALRRALRLRGTPIRGLARRPADPSPLQPEPAGDRRPAPGAAAAAAEEHLTAADRHDPVALRHLLDGADIAIDLCCFDVVDADALVSAWRRCTRPPRVLIFASALAERRPDHWREPLSDADPEALEVALARAAPSDGYGAGKRAARLTLQQGLGAACRTALLPQLFAADDPRARELAYLRDAHETGAVRLPGTGTQTPCVLHVDLAAAALLAYAQRSAAPYVLQVAPPTGPTVAALVAAILAGAQLDATVQPSPSYRGPHSAATEPAEGSACHALLPALPWRAHAASLLAAHRELGAGWRASTGAKIGT